MDFNLHSGEKVFTPYMYSGITTAYHDNFYYPNGSQVPENISGLTFGSWAFGIPMILGFKASFIDAFVLGIEIGARYTFSDSIDGSLPKDADNQQYKFGNINNNDWYVFSGFTLTYTFGENPCYCIN